MEIPELNFKVSVFGKLEKFSETISLAKVRIFYKGINRNNTYITEEFAEKLLKTLPYTPVKGIYDTEEGDFTDHGKKRDQGKIYGVVPQDPEISWEYHLDDDGVNREYACCKVLIYTGTYHEANEILDKPQSMELYSKTIKGEWKIIENKKVFEFSDGCFLGLMALGEETEPCFEGAAFFSLYNQLKEMVDEVNNFTKEKEKNLNLEGGVNQMNLNFKLSDNQKHDAIWNLLNINYNEENNWEINYAICDIYDQYALCYDYSTGSYSRVAYQKDDETDSISLGEKTLTFIMDISEDELKALKAIKALNSDSFEKIDEVFQANLDKVSTLTSENETLNAAKEDYEAKENQFALDIAERDNQIEELTSKVEAISTENAGLVEYKNSIETEQKDCIIEKYSLLLDEESISKYKEALGNYSIIDLEKELAYECAKTNPSIFSKNNEEGFVPKLKEPELTGAERILAKRKTKNGGEK